MTIDKKAEELANILVEGIGAGIWDGKYVMYHDISDKNRTTKLIASALRAERQDAAERGLRAYDMLPTETVANYDYCRRALRDAIIKEA